MDLSMIQNVSAAVLRSKGKNYTAVGNPEPQRISAPKSTGNPSGAAGVFHSAASKSVPIEPDTAAAAHRASVGIQKQQGLITYARQMQMARENRFRTRYDLLI